MTRPAPVMTLPGDAAGRVSHHPVNPRAAGRPILGESLLGGAQRDYGAGEHRQLLPAQRDMVEVARATVAMSHRPGLAVDADQGG